MFCKQCGKQVSDIERLCPNCGAATRLGPSASPQPIPYASPPRPTFLPTPNYLVQAILVTISCCMPFGIVAIVFAAQVNGKVATGDEMGALDCSNKARIWCWVAFLCGAIPMAIWFLVVVVAGIGQSVH